MDFVRKLPLLIAVFSAMLIGLVGRLKGVPDRENMLKMIIVMLIFYGIGLLIRGTINDIVSSIERKAEEERAKALLEVEQQKEELRNSEPSSSGSILDLTADDDLNFDTGDDFDALPVADFITKELNR